MCCTESVMYGGCGEGPCYTVHALEVPSPRTCSQSAVCGVYQMQLEVCVCVCVYLVATLTNCKKGERKAE